MHASLQPNTYKCDFPDVIKFRVAAHTILEKAIRFRHSDYISGSGSKVNQFVHVPTSVDTRHFIQIHARLLSNLAHRQTRQTKMIAGKNTSATSLPCWSEVNNELDTCKTG